MSLISPDNTFFLGSVLFGIAALAFWVDAHPIGRKTSGVIWALGVSMLLSNTGVIPIQSPVYSFVGESLVPLAIPLLLLKGDLRRIFRESGGVMVSFLIASSATVAGAVIGFFLIDLGEVGPKAAGVYTGGWIGGAVNFLAVSEAVEMTPQEFSISISASSVVSITALMILIALPSLNWVMRLVPGSASDGTATAQMKSPQQETQPNLKLVHITSALTLSFMICAFSELLATTVGRPQYSILFITVLTITVANLFPRMMDTLEGEFEVGMLLMYLFFVVVGAGTDAFSFLGSAVNLFFYGMLIILIHLTLVLIGARLFKIDLPEAIVASGAALVGPAPTAAIAISKGWRHLVTPGIMCGIFGYVIATFIGVTVTAVLS